LETEKVCVNLSAGELGKLDLLVAQGVYVSRTDVVRAALRREFADHDWDDAMSRDVAAGAKPAFGWFGIGYFRVTRETLEQAVEAGEKAQVLGAGIVSIDDDVSPDLADEGIGKIRIVGTLRGPKPVLDRLASRTSTGKKR
jgi:Arc/MetJ-type ribon-helix-helix transcriptional regulator